MIKEALCLLCGFYGISGFSMDDRPLSQGGSAVTQTQAEIETPQTSSWRVLKWTQQGYDLHEALTQAKQRKVDISPFAEPREQSLSVRAGKFLWDCMGSAAVKAGFFMTFSSDENQRSNVAFSVLESCLSETVLRLINFANSKLKKFGFFSDKSKFVVEHDEREAVSQLNMGVSDSDSEKNDELNSEHEEIEQNQVDNSTKGNSQAAQKGAQPPLQRSVYVFASQRDNRWFSLFKIALKISSGCFTDFLLKKVCGDRFGYNPSKRAYWVSGSEEALRAILPTDYLATVPGLFTVAANWFFPGCSQKLAMRLLSGQMNN